MDRQIRGEGTSESEWLRCEALQALPFEPLPALLPVASRLVICAPHPDDEILPCGGLVAAAFAVGAPIHIIAISDGEASHGAGVSATTDMLRKCRPEETAEALRRLKVEATIDRLGIPDGGFSEAAEKLENELRSRLLATDVVVIPWRLDGHPDHEVTADCGLKMGAEVGCRILETPIWGWHWARPDDVPFRWEQGVRFRMTPAEHARKVAAIDAFESQLRFDGGRAPILPAATLQRFTRDWEVYFR